MSNCKKAKQLNSTSDLWFEPQLESNLVPTSKRLNREYKRPSTIILGIIMEILGELKQESRESLVETKHINNFIQFSKGYICLNFYRTGLFC